MQLLHSMTSVSFSSKKMITISLEQRVNDEKEEEGGKQTHSINKGGMAVEVDLTHQIVKSLDLFFTIIDTSVKLVGDDLDDDIGRPDWV